MSEATFVRSAEENKLVLAAAVSPGEVWQLPNGEAAVANGLTGLEIGQTGGFSSSGKYTMTKAASVVCLDGSVAYWDHSAGACTPVPQYADRDFVLGVFVGDAAAADTTCVVDLNKCPRYIFDVHEDGSDTIPVLTAGTPSIASIGGSIRASFSATAEAQKLDILSKRSFPKTSKWIFEAIVDVVTNADADVVDVSVGVANATHASDPDSITESAFFHLDLGGSLNIFAESDDGTTEVAATDTTVDFAVGTPVLLQIDGRVHTALKYYVNGVRVLSATTFTLAAAADPLKALFHIEKSSNDTLCTVQLDHMGVRIAEQ